MSKDAAAAMIGDIRIKRQGGKVKNGAKSFAIMRLAKIKTLGNMGASLQHTFRERETPNANPDRRDDNEILVGGKRALDVLASWQTRAPEKIRKNAVHGLEYFVGGSPEKMKLMNRDEQDQYFRNALAWIEKRHGDKNILSAVIHRDETTPHMTVMTIPLDAKDKLNARAFVGSRAQLSELQTEFATQVGAEHGLERGQLRSTATHQRVQRVYGALNERPLAVELPERASGGFLGRGRETDAEYRQRLSWAASDALEGVKMAYAEDFEALTLRNRILEGRVRDNEHFARQHEAREKEFKQKERDFENTTRRFDDLLAAYTALGREGELKKTLQDYYSKQAALAQRATPEVAREPVIKNREPTVRRAKTIEWDDGFEL